ncbi:MAG TPA: hypothetical protein VIF13_07465 [Hyphomicrobium sp.]
MAVRHLRMLAVLAVAATAGAFVSPALWAGPSRAHSGLAAVNISGLRPPPLQISKVSRVVLKAGDRRIASAVSPLDLRKLSMSDFGDVEERR